MLPLEVEVGLLAERFHVTPSMMLEEDEAFMMKVVTGVNAYRALEARDAAMESHTPGSHWYDKLTEGQQQIIELVTKAMRDAS